MVTTLVTSSVAAFACKSKACAPPPVGTGGSTPTTGGSPGDSGMEFTAAWRQVESAVRDARKEFDPWNDKMKFPNRSEREAVACKMRSTRAIADELLNSEDGKAVVSDLLRSSIKSDGERNTLQHIAESLFFTSDLVEWFRRSKQGEATLSELAEGLIADANNYNSVYKLRDARQALAQFGLSAEDATPERVVAHLVARMFISNWAEASISFGGSIQSQFAAKRAYGLSQSVKGVDTIEGAANQVTTAIDSPLSKRLADAVLAAEHAATQRFLRETLGPDVKTVTLYRGVVNQYEQSKPGDVVDVESHPLSSWTADPEMADSFAGGRDGVVLKMEVPIEMIQSTPLSGRGCLDEAEFVIIGHPSQARRVA